MKHCITLLFLAGGATPFAGAFNTVVPMTTIRPMGQALKQPLTTALRSSALDKNPYSHHKVEGEHYDTIVIGSGLGGLSTASLLAQNGQNVLVLEQHYVAGGACHTFDTKGYHFGTGIHYVGNLEEDEPNNLRTMLNALAPKDDPILWDKMDGTI